MLTEYSPEQIESIRRVTQTMKLTLRALVWLTYVIRQVGPEDASALLKKPRGTIRSIIGFSETQSRLKLPEGKPAEVMMIIGGARVAMNFKAMT